jgi:hypothetical protein
MYGDIPRLQALTETFSNKEANDFYLKTQYSFQLKSISNLAEHNFGPSKSALRSPI